MDIAIRVYTREGRIKHIAMCCPALDIHGVYGVDSVHVRDILAEPTMRKVFYDAEVDMRELLKPEYSFTVDGRVSSVVNRIRLVAVDPPKGFAEDCDCEPATELLDDTGLRTYLSLEVLAILDTFYWLGEAMYDEIQACEYIEDWAIYPILRMEMNGVKPDWERMGTLQKELRDMLEEKMTSIRFICPGFTSVNKRKDLEALFKKAGINVSGKDWTDATLAGYNDPLSELVRDTRKVQTALQKLEKQIMDNLDGEGVIHTHFNLNGSVTGRITSDKPNMQGVPKRTEAFGKEIRSLFNAESGYTWCSIDYSQIEYALFVHYCDDESAKQAIREGKDFHQLVADLTGWDRARAKKFNFATLYGQSIPSLCKQEGISLEEGERLRVEYHKALPFVRPACKRIETEVKKGFHVKTLGGRILPVPAAESYKAVNYLMQGSAADILKAALVEAEFAGLWNILRLRLVIYDEVCFTAPKTEEGLDAVRHLRKIMETVYPLSIPIKTEVSCGRSWGNTSVDGYKMYSVAYG